MELFKEVTKIKFLVLKRIVLLLIAFLTFVGADAQDILFYGNGIEVTTSNDNFPELGDNTFFDEVEVGTTKTLTFQVKNVHNANIDLRTMIFGIPLTDAIEVTGLNATEFIKTEPLTYKLAPNETTTFDITFTPTSNGVKDAIINVQPTGYIFLFGYSNILSNNSFNIRGVGVGPEITVYQSGGDNIDHDNELSFDNGTEFGENSINSYTEHQFIVKNTGTRDLVISDWQVTSDETQNNEFVNSNEPALPLILSPDESYAFEIGYQPKDVNEDLQSITIVSNYSNSNFKLNFGGSGTSQEASDRIMMTQYHIDDSWENDFIEVKNISGQPIADGDYYLGVFRSNRDLTQSPGSNWVASIGELQPNEVKVFTRSDFGNNNNQFLNGKRLAVISTTTNGTCYQNRVDVIGVHGSTWSRNGSYNRGSCLTESAQINFNINDWIAVDVDDVALAEVTKNIAKGTYNMGGTTWNGTQWDNGLPDQTREVMISGDYNSTGNELLESCNLIVMNGAHLNFNNNSLATLDVHRNLEVYGDLTIGDTESLLMRHDNALVVGEISKIEKTTILNNNHDITYWSAPIKNAITSDVFIGVNSNRIFKIESDKINSAYADTEYRHWFNASGVMSVGKGYAVEGKIGETYPRQHEVIFSGEPNNGVISTKVVSNYTGSEDDDWNLIGNPYPSAIDADLFLQENIDNIDATVRFWTHNTPVSNGVFDRTDYVSYNLTGGSIPEVTNIIGSSQGFMVSGSETGEVVFKNEMRVALQNNVFYKPSSAKPSLSNENEIDKLWLFARNSTTEDHLLIAFLEEATDGYDNGYDGVKYKSSFPIRFYSKIDNEKFTIQGLSPFTRYKTVDIGLEVTQPGNYNIGISKRIGSLKGETIFITDHLLGVTHELSKSNYSFKVKEPGNFQDRFTLQFVDEESLNHIKQKLSHELLTISSAGNLHIASNQIISNIKVYDILGRILTNLNPNQKDIDVALPNLQKGTILIINTTLESGEVIHKKIAQQ